MKKYQFYCDMDGVLCNFIDAATNIVNETLEHRAKSKESMAGKLKWIEKNLGVPIERVILDDDKYKYTMLDNRQGVLIDDMWYNIKPYRKHGGEAIYHNNMRTTMGLIKRYAE
mgnify:CR=1 FL=1